MPILREKIIHEPLADLASLKAVDTTNTVDDVLYPVKSLGIFFLDKSSSETADDRDIIQPTVGAGRFKRLTLSFLPTTLDGKISSLVLPDSIDSEQSVINFYNPTGGLPVLPNIGDRYISLATANTWTLNYIYEWTGVWTETVINKFTLCIVTATHTLYAFDNTSWESLGTTETYTSATPSTTTVGGIPAGTSYVNTQWTTIIDQMLHAYLYPYFSGFSLNQSNAIEVGATIAGAHTFNWSTVNSGNINVNSIGILDVSTPQVLRTGLANSGSDAYNFTTEYGDIQKILPGSHLWRISAVNTLSQTFTADYAVSWYWKRYWGTNVATSLTSSDVLALANNGLSSAVGGSYSLAAGGYKYFCFPSSWTQPTNFKDHATGFSIDMQSPVTLSVTNGLGIATNYSIYRTTYILTDAVVIDVT